MLLLIGSFAAPLFGQSPTNEPIQPTPALIASPLQQLHQLIERKSSTRELLRFLERLTATHQLAELGEDRLAWSSWKMPGWRWQSELAGGGRVVLAVQSGWLVAIRESSSIEISVKEFGPGQPTPFPQAGTVPTWRSTTGTLSSTAMSAKHLASKHPELFAIYFYFAGPLREIVNARSLPTN